MTTRRISRTTTARIRAIAGNRCGYCLTPQTYAMQVLEIEHIVPRVKGGGDSEENLWLACRLCNNAKGIKTRGTDPLTKRQVHLFNPRVSNGIAISIGAVTEPGWTVVVAVCKMGSC